jgi:hypothetical protein
LEAHKNTWGLLYNISNVPEHDILVKHCMDLHNKRKNEEHNDINRMDIMRELDTLELYY